MGITVQVQPHLVAVVVALVGAVQLRNQVARLVVTQLFRVQLLETR